MKINLQAVISHFSTFEESFVLIIERKSMLVLSFDVVSYH